jgi:pSer/pThr/pTyr-binding forkhead associated (FHA) protein
VRVQQGQHHDRSRSGADIYLDNPGISREHAKVELSSNGLYKIKDLNSANGMFVNDQPVKVHHIINNDVVFVGKFALWFTYDEDKRADQNAARRLAHQDEGTTVLKTSGCGR